MRWFKIEFPSDCRDLQCSRYLNEAQQNDYAKLLLERYLKFNLYERYTRQEFYSCPAIAVALKGEDLVERKEYNNATNRRLEEEAAKRTLK